MILPFFAEKYMSPMLQDSTSVWLKLSRSSNSVLHQDGPYYTTIVGQPISYSAPFRRDPRTLLGVLLGLWSCPGTEKGKKQGIHQSHTHGQLRQQLRRLMELYFCTISSMELADIYNLVEVQTRGCYHLNPFPVQSSSSN